MTSKIHRKSPNHIRLIRSFDRFKGKRERERERERRAKVFQLTHKRAVVVAVVVVTLSDSRKDKRTRNECNPSAAQRVSCSK